MKWTLALALYSLLIGCAHQTELAKQSLIEKVNSDYPVEFKNIVSYPGKVSCGAYQSFGKWGKGHKFRSFIFRADQVNTRPTNLDVQIFCSSDPGASLYDALGIKTSTDSSSNSLPNSSPNSSGAFQKIRDDLQLLHAALEAFYLRNRTYPSARDGLETLVVPQKYARRPGPGENGSYLEQLPLDPWNRAYLYEGAGLGGVKGEPKMSTLGADGLLGGKDQNADIKSSYIKYLDHIATM